MPAIDSRATVTCNLGEVISGGVSDSYLQNSGLVMTRGQLTLAGVQTPAIGSEVTISYQLTNGSSGTLPRSLVVLSAFADPFRGTTEVSVGCLLTYLDGVMPVPSLQNGEAAYVGPRQLECLNGLDKSAFVPPIFAKDLFSYCVDKLGITGSADLKGTYMMEKYDLSGGYVQAINNLLLSEGMVGYMSPTGGLTVVPLGKAPGSGASLSDKDIIDVSGVNSGEQPASIVIVPYIDKKMEKYEPDDARWEQVETVGKPESVTLQYTEGTTTVTHTPTTVTTTQYGPPADLTDQCELFDGGFGDLSNTVVGTTTKRSTVMGHAAGGYCTALLEAGKKVNTTLGGNIEQITAHEFDEKDRPLRTVTETYEPFFVYAGRMSLQWVFDESHVVLGNERLLVERSVEEYDYAGEANIPEGFRPGQDVPEPVVYQRVHRYTYQAWGKTQGGSQGPAESTTLEAFSSADDVISYVRGSLGLVLTDSDVTSNKAFNPKGQRRPGEADRAVDQGTLDGKGRETKYVELQFEDNGDGTRVIQYSPPHLTESYFTSTGDVVNVDSYAASANFGRVQHRLAVGNRLGMNITSTPDKLALDPYAGLQVTAGGFAATYAINALNFSFGRDGIVASVDALFLGGTGINGGRRSVKSRGACWFYLPDGYDPADLPLASEGQIIPPFNERVNVAAGIALGTRVASQLAQGLIPQTVEIGVALGVDGTNGTFKQLAHIGVAAGVEATASKSFVNRTEIGVALGVNAEPVQASIPVGVGVALGVNVGPALEASALLMHFDDLDPDMTFSETLWVDSSPNGITLTNTKVGTFTSVTLASNPDFGVSRFGDGFGYFISGSASTDSANRGGVLSERTTALNLGDEWTVEFWLYLSAGDIPETKPSSAWTLVCMDRSGKDGRLGFEVLFQDDLTPVLQSWFFREGRSFRNTLGGNAIPLDTWIHVAMAKTLDGVKLFQNGNGVAGFGWSDLATEQVDRIGIGGLMNSDSTTIPWNNCVARFDDLRVMNNKAVYDINASVIEVPTGPFSG